MIKALKKLRRKLFGLDEQEATTHRLIQENLNRVHQSYSRVLIETLSQNFPKTLLNCTVNGVPLRVSVDILKTYAHCLQGSPNLEFTYTVESHCVDWLAQWLNPGDIFLDVGAAYGVISLPLAQKIGPTGQVYAFEPARRTHRQLQKLLTDNALTNITVLPMAIADQAGSAEFIEYSAENQFSWATDTSTLADGVTPTMKHETYTVEIITLDQFVAEQNIIPKAIKIDIEGFELYALQGAQTLLKSAKPYLCIDIHQDVKTQQSSLITIQPWLESLGYRCHVNQHTLFAQADDA
jgi:FkbM family methyltransferase